MEGSLAQKAASAHPFDSLRCQCVEMTEDEFTEKTLCRVAAQPFFIYTPPSYRKLLDGQEFLVASVALAHNKDAVRLHLFIEIASERAAEQFGDVGKRTFLTLELLKQKPVYAITQKGAKAEIRNGKTYYHVVYTMDDADARLLAKHELDKVRLHWTKGKQLFEIYHLDVLREQFECF